jgi:hypothetical protein
MKRTKHVRTQKTEEGGTNSGWIDERLKHKAK